MRVWTRRPVVDTGKLEYWSQCRIRFFGTIFIVHPFRCVRPVTVVVFCPSVGPIVGPVVIVRPLLVRPVVRPVVVRPLSVCPSHLPSDYY